MRASLQIQAVQHYIDQQAQSPTKSAIPIKPTISLSFDPCQGHEVDNALG
jgi:hypothetical protein